MEQYPSIIGSAKAPLGKPCVAQYKYDGSNLRWEWSPKKGFHKYGTRRELFDKTDPVFGMAIEMFHDTLAADIVRRTKNFVRNPQRITRLPNSLVKTVSRARMNRAIPKRFVCSTSTSSKRECCLSKIS